MGHLVFTSILLAARILLLNGYVKEARPSSRDVPWRELRETNE